LKRLRVQPQARADAEHAAAWYEAERQGLGIEFILELDIAIEKAAKTPLAYACRAASTHSTLTPGARLSKIHNLIRLPCRHIISQEPT